MKRMNGKASKHNYPKAYGFLRHKRWKGNCNDAARKAARKEIEQNISSLENQGDNYA